MKSLVAFLLTVFGIYSYSQEKILPADYRNGISSQYCWYTKHDMKPFNGYIKFKSEDAGNFEYSKIENGCHRTAFEEFNSKNELLYRGKYPYDKTNNQILSYELDSVNLGKSELWDKEFTDTLTLTKIRILTYFNTEFSDNIEKITLLNGVIYSNDEGKIYSIHYKNGIATKLITYYDDKEFDITNPNPANLKRKESHELLFNENGNIYDTDLSDKTYPFIFTGEQIKWDKTGKIIKRKILSNKISQRK